MHTNGPDQWGVYARSKGSTDDWILLDNHEYTTHMYSRKAAQELNEHSQHYEYAAFVSFDGAQVHHTRKAE